MRIYNSSTRNHTKKKWWRLRNSGHIEKVKTVTEKWFLVRTWIPHTSPPPSTWSASDFPWPLQFPKAIANEEPCHLCLVSIPVNLPLPRLCFSSIIDSQRMCTYLRHPFNMLKASAHLLCPSAKVNDRLIHQDASSTIASYLCKSPV